ncbi:uncharacterized protein LOC122643588 [Telopea speciosissima]|uniref:uncharacterized protein LOC122643588 n=1 Tax=Telopea speciosissima TaxID=54955 RepID=UPI001CC3C908|nr:uncharacterized protein LOC122643588 [Telopea speciosissima]
MAEKAFHEFQLVNNPPSGSDTDQSNNSSYISESNQAINWIPLSPSWVKLNVDAAWTKGTKKGGIGNIIRDHLGIPLLAYSVGVLCDLAFMAEAIAICSGLLLAANGGFKKVLVESNCYPLIKQLSSSDSELAIISIHHDIVQLRKSFDDCSFSFVPRTTNTVADTLARSALSVESPIVWPLTSPWLLHLCESEANVCDDSLVQ